MSFLYWLEESMLGVWVGQSWGYPLVLSCHAVGMAVVVGTVIMINLRLLGFARAMPVSFFLELSRVTLLGVILNIASGTLLNFSITPRSGSSWCSLCWVVCPCGWDYVRCD